MTKDERPKIGVKTDPELSQLLSELAFNESLAKLVGDEKAAQENLRKLDAPGLGPGKSIEIYRRYYQRECEKSRLRVEVFNLPRQIEDCKHNLRSATSAGAHSQYETSKFVREKQLSFAIESLKSKKTRLQEITSHDAEWNDLIKVTPPPRRVVTRAPRGAEKDHLWSHSDDYRKVSYNGETFLLTEQQASIVKLLDEARATGSEYVSGKKIKSEVKCGKISDSFRAGNGRSIWEKLITREEGSRRGMYKLNLPSLQNT